MSKWTAEHVLEAATTLQNLEATLRGDIEDIEQDAIHTCIAIAEEYAAHLAAQAEWPSEEDVARDVGRRLFKGLLSTQLSEREVRDAVVAALQSVRPPVGVVSDGDVDRARLAILSSSEFDPGSDGYIDDTAIRAALESYASRHAPTKD